MQFPVPDQTRVNEPLLAGRAEWISPGFEEPEWFPGNPDMPTSGWYGNPPPADGRKIVIADTDHFAPGGGDALWAWKTFLRGHHPILMDFGIIAGVKPPDPTAGGPMAFDAFEPARLAMGDTVRYAERVWLIEMQPRGDLSSTGYLLASPGVEYLALQPEAGAVHGHARAGHVLGRVVRRECPQHGAGGGHVRRDHGTRALPVPLAERAEPAVPEIDRSAAPLTKTRESRSRSSSNLSRT